MMWRPVSTRCVTCSLMGWYCMRYLTARFPTLISPAMQGWVWPCCRASVHQFLPLFRHSSIPSSKPAGRKTKGTYVHVTHCGLGANQQLNTCIRRCEHTHNIRYEAAGQNVLHSALCLSPVVLSPSNPLPLPLLLPLSLLFLHVMCGHITRAGPHCGGLQSPPLAKL